MNLIKTTIAAFILAVALTGVSMAEQQSIDINSATAEQMAETLHGIGQSKAEAIVAYREQHGDFEHIDELVNVQGIGLRTVDRNRDRIALPGANTDS